MRIILLFCLVGSWSCQKAENKNGDNTLADTIARVKIQDSIDIKQNIPGANFSVNDPEETPLPLRTLSDFQHDGPARPATTNDSLFVRFLTSFTTYQNEVNDQLFDDPDYEVYNTLAYSEDNLVKPRAIQFRDSVKRIGFAVRMSEGMIFLDKDSAFLMQFRPYLTERMNTFLREYIEEINRPLAEDGGLILSDEEHVRRLLFWEDFSRQHPDFELASYVKQQFDTYLFFLMFGADNTPVYEWESNKMRAEMIELYKSIIRQYPNARASVYLRDYLTFIGQQDFTYGPSFSDYAKEKFPDRFGQ